MKSTDKFNELINYIKTNCPESDCYCNFYQDFDNSYKPDDENKHISIGHRLDDEGLSVKFTNNSHGLICSKFLRAEDLQGYGSGISAIQYLLSALMLEPLKYYKENLQSMTTHYYKDGLPLHKVCEAIDELEERGYCRISGVYATNYKDVSNKFIFYYYNEEDHDIYIFKDRDELIEFVNDSFFEAE